MEPDNYDYDSTPSSNAVQPTTHTEFLDLTNGEGGEEIGAEAMMYDDEDSQYRDFAATPPPIASETQAADAGVMGHGNSSMSTATMGGIVAFDPSTPGRVVETGQEHTGRWTKEEHEAFLSALKMYGKEWKKVAAKVKTRTVVQTRTHAQKYFQKLAKASGGTEDAAQIEMRVASEAKKYSEALSSQKKKQRVTPLKVSRTASVASAAKVISSLHNAQQQPLAGTSLSHGFLDDLTTIGSNALSTEQQPSAFSSTSHGFSSAFTEPAQPVFASSLFAAPMSTIGTNTFPMKIVAPDHDSAIKRGKFPEPSPAACGKRKLAEIAAARMLAGVAASETLLPPPSSGIKFDSGRVGLTDNIDDGVATPPPTEATLSRQMLKIPSPPGSLDTKPPPPLAAAFAPKKTMGLSLQIVNPETLGVSHEQIEKRRRDGQTSPVTPWEGQLQALVRYVTVCHSPRARIP
jgi:SHAQKYF class myb-like DNA-binding protein